MWHGDLVACLCAGLGAGRYMPRLNGILETAIHVRDLSASAGFYQQVLGLELIERSERLCALSVAGRHLLLLFLQGGSSKPLETAGGMIPPHDGSGSLHFAFAIDRIELEPWVERLRERGVALESRVDWELGGTSLYFRDPDGHLVELATPGNWPIY
jgi:catechol 2,3-dioxygenase-like lactoylglutathione lyase family enzyme